MVVPLVEEDGPNRRDESGQPRETREAAFLFSCVEAESSVMNDP